MSSIFPLKKKPQLDLEDPSVLELGSEEAEVVLDALSSKTTREIFLRIYDDPCAVSDIASETGNSIQNVKYHVDKLKKAGLIKVTGTWYSETGNEMNVYSPKDEAIVLVASNMEVEETLHRAVKSLGSVAVVTAIGIVVLGGLIDFDNSNQVGIAEITAENLVNFGAISLTPTTLVTIVFVLGVLAGVLGIYISRKI
ncbi:Transcriptional regulator containing HTH domain ArsR family [Methanonatronarchaeum thermophilum]|uniref:Transcriptional regulator containing HTH domain ArsR family n=1 Tax=Methanonatronarchaeum thermophilum TaxID=1927129 RepID=A0A1Y3G9N1_9EURY|nr:helix-turn-helix domain-containing protein [Methanonatronarchaeum thermophilum]OUJ18138.1 Transcriptional regulator containing HTH domain ArsR family [Methanonatronarchaeum thermophilum]